MGETNSSFGSCYCQEVVMSSVKSLRSESTDPVDGSEIKKPRTESSPGAKLPLAEQNASIVTSGLLFLASDVNRKLRLVSQKNEFDGIKVKDIIIDGGCSSLVIAIPDLAFLSAVLAKYSDREVYNIRLVPGKGISQIVYVLSVHRLDGEKFAVHLCTDILPTKRANGMFTDSLQFALCLDDIKHILDSEYTDILSEFAINTLQAYAEKCDPLHSMRMEFTLLGQSVLRHVSSLRLREIEFFVNPLLYQKNLWDVMRLQELALMEVLSFTPASLQSSCTCILTENVEVKFFSELHTVDI